ncbi:MAG: lipoprotein signal peptidase [Paludibacteraceae bacterium]|nr:lipoprotein signal peptidase [Candidatus Colousia faecequi]MCQ2338288.1 lipoprotein signal peptidase [Paludibacteraceae bacterium]
MMSSKRSWWVFPSIMLLGLLADQILKFHIKLHFALGEEYVIFDWFRLVFVENPGMAFGVTLGSKMILSSFRIIVAAFLVWYLIRLIKADFNFGFLVVMTCILTGAIGNIIDCVFYGSIFTASDPATVATFATSGNGYAQWMTGKVVDMFYFPLFSIPEWMPVVGGDIFFSPVFNIADSFITVGIIWIIIGYRRAFNASFDAAGLNDKKNKR